ncbi:hypothetical protein PoB_001591900 [Plakobranchus ocellatus]|uniref:Uncharacterized protein n=1 Tax=Plakobranchus ocellatus TaxID=259542 RepID=A0AAV3Z266_9GAST|nr:hypothetical protein PoB_001591900 [Plakobranchus ocellatus]
MEQDLSLMKQLLTLNETIEELKWQRQYYSCSTSYASLSPSGRLLSSSSWRPGEDGQGSSTWSVSDTEMYESDDDLRGLNSTIESTGLGAGAVPPGPPSLETSTSSSGTLTPSVGGSPSSAASLAIAQHQIQPPPTGLMTEPTWHSTRKARRASRESNQISLDSLNIRLDHTGDGEGGLAAEVHAALRKRAEDKDLSLFPAAFLDSYRRRSIRDSIEDQTHSRDTKLSKQLAAKHKASPASPISSGNNCKFSSDHLDLTPGPIIRHDRDQHSFDSGIHEPGTLSEEIVWNV